MTIISIDFSILYPGITICRDFKEFEFLAIVNTNTTKKHRVNLDNLTDTYKNIKIKYTESRRRKDPIYHKTERIKLGNYIELTNLLISELQTYNIDPEDTIIAIEGISFGSSGNSLVDISQATGIIKDKLVTNLLNGDIERFFVFSPGELKNAIGCKGNAGKTIVYEQFKEDPILKGAFKSDLFKAINNEDWILDKNDKVASPIIDLIDSYLGIVKVYNILK